MTTPILKCAKITKKYVYDFAALLKIQVVVIGRL